MVFDRRHERFAYLALDGAEVMIQEAAGPGRWFRTAPLEQPFGRGVNLLGSVVRAGLRPIVPVEERTLVRRRRHRGGGTMEHLRTAASRQSLVRRGRSRLVPAAILYQPRRQTWLSLVTAIGSPFREGSGRVFWGTFGAAGSLTHGSVDRERVPEVGGVVRRADSVGAFAGGQPGTPPTVNHLLDY